MKINTPLVSVAMATYNGAKYVTEQLNSILNQSYKNIEIVITDDASTDNTLEIIKKLQLNHPQIKLFTNAENSGVNKTFESSFKNCSGNFIAIADQDDIWNENKIELLLNNIDSEDAIYSNSELVDKLGNSLKVTTSQSMKMQSYYSGIPFLMGNCIPGHSILMRRSFLINILPIPEAIMFDRWISFCAAGNNGIKYLDAALVKYRQHDNNTVGVGKSKNKKLKKSKNKLFKIKIAELLVCQKANIKDLETRKILNQMIEYFTKKLSIKRSIFFFKNMESLLIIKNKPYYRKVLYCIKMYFRPNY